ncbi:Lacal_2735 family protein [Ekhidna sp.]
MGLFSKTSPKEKLQKKYAKLMEESYNLSKSNRKASDEKVAEAEDVLKQINALV